jgi:hypothetical protein
VSAPRGRSYEDNSWGPWHQSTEAITPSREALQGTLGTTPTVPSQVINHLRLQVQTMQSDCIGPNVLAATVLRHQPPSQITSYDMRFTVTHTHPHLT